MRPDYYMWSGFSLIMNSAVHMVFTMELVFWICYGKEKEEMLTIAVQAINAEAAALKLMRMRNVDPNLIWNLVEACDARAFSIYQAHTKGSLNNYNIGNRMLISQIEHQRKICETFAYANRSSGRRYAERWLPF